MRERLGLPGAKNACEQGECGSCSVFVDGVLCCACLVLAATIGDAEITTVEAIADDDALSDVQRAFVAAGAVQCGFCTPGLVMAVHDLLERSPEPSELEVREAISGNLCRCTGYGRILQPCAPVQETARIGRDHDDDHRATRRVPRGRRERAPPRRHPQGAGPLRVRLGPVGRGDAVGRDPAVAAPVRPHPQHRPGAAWRIPGVRAIVTAEDVPGSLEYGLEHRDQPVFAATSCATPVSRSPRSPPTTPRRRAVPLAAIRVEYEPLDPLTDPEEALDAPPIHPDGNLFRHVRIRHGDRRRDRRGRRRGVLRGRHAGPGVPRARSRVWRSPTTTAGVELYISTQWLHVDRDQVAACLALPLERVRLTLAGVGGAFGAREDVSLQVHVCLLALRTGRPVKMMYGREESFFGHVHRHPARMWYRHHADRDGRLVKVEARILLDGGAYTSSSTRRSSPTRRCFAAGPYRVPNAVIDGYAVRTNNPPCGAMRGFGAVQNCFAHEAQMDKLAAALGIDPVELRLAQRARPPATPS